MNVATGTTASLEKIVTLRTISPLLFSVRGSKLTRSVVSPPAGTVLSLTSDAVHPQELLVSLMTSVAVPVFFRVKTCSTF